ncbi:type 1 fimbria pilin [Luteibacter rhizovicinus]|uniref:Type 1 fimbria pilin n=1 Tax=Luteibacter rhizovicinus TaxID=242606 RepID=A0A4R3YKS4_9GAMM|nr:fimbrial protein [Luteibacter rhizovicinus]TCV92742.1 type 1 fimbria pilin [Luteibacter rhizovicinus]
MLRVLSIFLALSVSCPVATAKQGCKPLHFQGVPQRVGFGRLVVPVGVEDGRILAEILSTPAYTTPTLNYICYNSTRRGELSRFTTLSSYGQGVYETGIAGLGIRIYTMSTSDHLPQREVPWNEYFPGRVSWIMQNFRFKVQLVKTGPLSSGTLGGGQVATWGHDGSRQITLDLTPIEVVAPTPTCAFSGTSASFPLRDVLFGNLGADGGSPWIHGSVTSAGCSNVNAVRMSFAGQADAGDAGLFAVTGGAAGVGIELRSIQPDMAAVPNSPKPIVLTPRAAGGQYAFKARYKRNGRPFSAGRGDANITVHVAYD